MTATPPVTVTGKTVMVMAAMNRHPPPKAEPRALANPDLGAGSTNIAAPADTGNAAPAEGARVAVGIRRNEAPAVMPSQTGNELPAETTKNQAQNAGKKKVRNDLFK